MDLGVVVGGGLRSLGRLAREAEEAGFESVWVAETTSSAFVQAAIVASSTERVTIGTNIALVFPRSPTITAMTARDLAELSAGRFILGLGTQVKRVNEQRFGVPFEHPAPKIAEAVQVIREILATFEGKPIEHRGRFYSITMPPFPGAGPPPGRIPIYIAAVNRLMVETAARVADGLLGHPMTSPDYVREVVRPAVERGSAATGRTAADVNLSTGVIAHVATSAAERDAARREAALQIGFYATTRTYAPVLEFHDFEDRVEPLREAYGRGDLAEMTELALPMVAELALVGGPEECRERLTHFDRLVDRVIVGGSWIGASTERLEQNFRALVDAFAPAR